ncbi:MAG TPA: AFG1/ZapE family ATPase, partial [Devosia sp.]|nr:AFG1/ZapE family ATPase [Devosia sp.]
MAARTKTSKRSGPVGAAYAALVARGALTADPAQHDAAALLDTVLAGLLADKPKGMLGKLFDSKTAPVRGLYLHGEVGRGKTMLMDLFFAAAPISGKRRVHFHEFMDEIHAGMAAFRKSAKGKDADPVEAVVKPILKSGLRLLCL